MVKTLVTLMNTAARACRVKPPSNWISTTTDTHLELRGLLFETARDLQGRIDWANLTLDHEIVGSGSATYSLPSDYLRTSFDTETGAVFERGPMRRAVLPLPSNAAWTNMLASQSAGAGRWYRIVGSQIEFYRALEASGDVVVSYQSGNWILDNDNVTRRDDWTEAADVPLLSDHLLELGTVWRFRRDNGLAYKERQGEYEMVLARLANNDRGTKTIDMTGGRVRTAGIPETIPDTLPVA